MRSSRICSFVMILCFSGFSSESFSAETKRPVKNAVKKAKPKKTAPTAEPEVNSEETATTNTSTSTTSPAPGGESFNYVFHGWDSDFGIFDGGAYGTLNVYPLYAAQMSSKTVTPLLGYSSYTAKAEGLKADGATTYAGAEIVVPISNFVISAIPQWAGQTNKTTSEFTSSTTGANTVTFKDTEVEVRVPFRLLFKATPMFDVSVGADYTSSSGKSSSDSSSGRDSTDKQTSTQLDIAAGAHSSAFEAALHFKPGTKTKKSTTTGEKTTDKDVNLNQWIIGSGRYKFAPNLFGTGYAESSTSPDDNDTGIGFGGGYAGSGLDFEAFLLLTSGTANGSNSDTKTKISGTVVKLQAVSISSSRMKFLGGLVYGTNTTKDDYGTTTISLWQLNGGASFNF